MSDKTQRHRLPGDPSPRELVERIIRVDQAGEYGAMRIYEGQLAVLKGRASEATIAHMAEQERRHLEVFDRLVAERKVRPTALAPLWHVAGFALGAATALLGEKAAMTCTSAVEEVIDRHYADQAAKLGPEEADLKAQIGEFRADEAEHRDTALAHGAEDSPGQRLLAEGIKAATRLAIKLSERI
jgi:ubiquinone biosynthesis monooxygenase Coq7